MLDNISDLLAFSIAHTEMITIKPDTKKHKHYESFFHPILNSRILLGFDKRLPMLTRAGSGLKVSRWVGRYRTVA